MSDQNAARPDGEGRPAEKARELVAAGLRGLFATDPTRGRRFAHSLGGLYVDLSRQLVDDEVLALLLEEAESRGVLAMRDRMFAGDLVNVTERRAALHVALRAAEGDRYLVDGRDVVADVLEERRRAAALAEGIRTGSVRGAGGAPVGHVVVVGIGGSHLGPALVCDAFGDLAPEHLDVRFLSNVDPAAFARATRRLDASATFVVVCSKSFTTDETRRNAAAVRRWLSERLGREPEPDAFVAVTARPQVAEEEGFAQDRILRFWDWVGGRFSLTSVVGFPVMVALGPDRFEQLLEGFRDVDVHFRDAAAEANIPILTGVVAVWNANHLGCSSRVVVPYSTDLALLPAWLQQLELESLGKRVRADGTPVGSETAPALWGGVGTDGQHAFFQWLHQGTWPVSVDLIGVVEGRHGLPEHHEVLLANLLAQGRALAFGRSAHELDSGGDGAEGAPDLVAHRVVPGDRPSTTILLDRLDPRNLGRLLALYEHEVAVQGWMWGVNPFDQFGVELGKELAVRARELLRDGVAGDDADQSEGVDSDRSDVPEGSDIADPATEALVRWVRRSRRQSRSSS
ncbi:MAG: glucose-6-phosphate isomerase [Acidimicrobiales bacterium]|nr:MAG: glucose-6-phosphate isomerase [Acidimicrobiales bacterium]